jgi:hypothetical protein
VTDEAKLEKERHEDKDPDQPEQAERPDERLEPEDVGFEKRTIHPNAEAARDRDEHDFVVLSPK